LRESAVLAFLETSAGRAARDPSSGRTGAMPLPPVLQGMRSRDGTSTILREESPGACSGEESRPPSPDLTAAGQTAEGIAV
jgi:hypothetical protein